jgi:hypothetical protein
MTSLGVAESLSWLKGSGSVTPPRPKSQKKGLALEGGSDNPTRPNSMYNKKKKKKKKREGLGGLALWGGRTSPKGHGVAQRLKKK